MKKSVVVLATILALGFLAADVILQQPVYAYAAAQNSGAQAEQPKDETKGKGDDGHSGHH